jgi:hypothetical protein
MTTPNSGSAPRRCAHISVTPGTDVMICKNIFAEKIGFFAQNLAKLYKTLIITLVLEKNANFLAENCQKPQKIVIITSVPDWANCLGTF